MDFPDREWLITDLWRDREYLMIYSLSGMGKSWFAWSMATVISGGGQIREGFWKNESQMIIKQSSNDSRKVILGEFQRNSRNGIDDSSKKKSR